MRLALVRGNSRINLRLLPVFLASSLLLSMPMPAFSDTFKEAYNKARALQASGDDEGAMNYYGIAASLSPVLANDARLALARMYAKVGRYVEAESEWERLLSGANVPLSLKYEYGEFLINQGKFNSALSYWNGILAQNPNDATAMYYVGICLESTDNIDSSQEYYQKAIEASPGSSIAEHARSKLSRLGNATEARASSKFFPVDPELGNAGLGWWNLLNMPIHVYVDDGNGILGYRSEMKGYVNKAVEAWHQASRGKISFVIDPPDPRGEAAWKTAYGNEDPLVKFNKSRSMPDDPVKTGIHVHWTPSLGGIAIGLAWTNPMQNKIDENNRRECLITSGHIFLNTNSMADGTALPKNISAANSSILEKQDRVMSEVTVHEFGHALGLTHSPNPKDVMCSGIFSLNSSDLVEGGRTLSAGDCASLSEHYNRFEGTGFGDAEIITNPGSSAVKAPVVSAPNQPVVKGGNSAIGVVPAFDQKPKSELDSVVFEINGKHYTEALSRLDKILKKEPGNMQARYMRGVVQVFLHNYPEAEHDYALVIKSAAGTPLAKRAEAGLEKIKH